MKATNRRVRTHWAVILVATALLPAPGSAGQVTWGIRAHGGYATAAMEEANLIADVFNRGLAESGSPQRLDELKGGPVFGVDIVCHLSPYVALVASYDRASVSVDNRVADFSAIVRHEQSVSANFFTAGLQLSPAPETPIYITVKGGVGSGNSDLEYQVVVLGQGEEDDVLLVTDGTGSGFAFEAGVGGELRPSRGGPFSIFSEVAYRYRNLGDFTGNLYESGTRVGDSQMEMDFSGVAIKLGLGIDL